jgi:hypothetical protein
VAVIGLGAALAVTVPATVGAWTPPFTECPAAGHDTSCATLISIQPNGRAVVETDSGQSAFNGATGDLVGIFNGSNALVSSLGLAGSAGNDIFAFNGHGVCAVTPSPCFSKTEFGPTGYEGPGTAFTVADSNDGKVNFAGGLSPGTSTYFSLQSSPFTVSSVGLTEGISLTGSSFSATAGTPVSPEVASFTDGGSTAPPSDFTATVQWGDGGTGAGVVSQPGGAGTPYEVTGTYTYGSFGTYTTSVTVTDTSLALNTATASGTATVGAAITASPVAIPTLTAGSPFAGPVATFTDANPTATVGEFTVSIAWGDGGMPTTGSVSQPGGPGTTFDVSGAYTYAASGSYSATVSIRDTSGVTAVVDDPVTVVNGVIVCTGSGCSGTVTGSGETDEVQSTATSGSIDVSINPTDGSLDCGDSFRHAPDITTITENGVPSGKIITIHVTFPLSELQGPPPAHIEVCFQSAVPFKDLEGDTVTTGLLPSCFTPAHGRRAVPCVAPRIRWVNVDGVDIVHERLTIPTNDPRFR